MARPRRDFDATPGRGAVVAQLTAIGTLAAGVGLVWVALHAAAQIQDKRTPPANPIELIIDLATGRRGPAGHRLVAWSTPATVILAAGVLLLFMMVAAVATLAGRRGRGRKRPDRAAAWMAGRRDLRGLTRAGAAAKAQRLGVPEGVSPGVPLGRAVLTGADLWSSWEDMLVVVAGPRTMKPTAYAIPAIMAAPGAVLATSNKRDVVDATRAHRATLGQVWVCDPQRVAATSGPSWWWNPLTFIAPLDPATGRPALDPATGQVAADEARAEQLAAQLVASAVPLGARTDAYFDGEAENLIGLLLLAAAVAGDPITTVYGWLADPEQTGPTSAPVAALLEQGFGMQAQSLQALATLADKQRDGVYGTARARLGWMRNRALAAWVTPPVRAAVPQFHPGAYAGSTDTLYLLSKEGQGSAGPVVAALTLAVVTALEERATLSPGARLTVPALGVLDEAANICRFKNLDSYYSHYGSRGIIMMTILQNWAQGEEVWGKTGMEKLWSAANVKIYGGAVDDDRFLRRLSDLVGTHTHLAHSESRSAGRGREATRSVSSSVQERTILTVGELRELPQGRAVAFTSGTPAVLLEPVPWWDGDHAAAIRSSLETYTPQAGIDTPTLAASVPTAETSPAPQPSPVPAPPVPAPVEHTSVIEPVESPWKSHGFGRN